MLGTSTPKLLTRIVAAATTMTTTTTTMTTTPTPARTARTTMTMTTTTPPAAAAAAAAATTATSILQHITSNPSPSAATNTAADAWPPCSLSLMRVCSVTASVTDWTSLNQHLESQVLDRFLLISWWILYNSIWFYHILSCFHMVWDVLTLKDLWCLCSLSTCSKLLSQNRCLHLGTDVALLLRRNTFTNWIQINYRKSWIDWVKHVNATRVWH